MEKKNSIVPSIEEGKRRLSLYNSLKKDLAGVEHENRRQIVYELMDYVQRLETDQRMPLSIRLKYYYCAETIFRFLYDRNPVSCLWTALIHGNGHFFLKPKPSANVVK